MKSLLDIIQLRLSSGRGSFILPFNITTLITKMKRNARQYWKELSIMSGNICCQLKFGRDSLTLKKLLIT